MGTAAVPSRRSILIAIVAAHAPATRSAQPTNLAPLPRLLAYTEALGLERYLACAKRGVSSLALALLWLVLAWRGSGRPHHLDDLQEPLLAALLGWEDGRLPCAKTLARSLRYFSAKALRAAVEHAYLAEVPRRTGRRVWAAVDAHQIPYWGRGQLDRFQKGWSGSHSRRLRGYWLYLAVDTETGQIITFLLARGRLRDARLIALLARRVRTILGRRLAGVVGDCGFTSRAALAALLGPWVYVPSLRRVGPQLLARPYRQRWRVEQAIEALLNGQDLDHLVNYHLHPNQVAIGFRLLARNLALGLQLAEAAPAGARPAHLLEPYAFRMHHVEGLATFLTDQQIVTLLAGHSADRTPCHLPWSQLIVRYTA